MDRHSPLTEEIESRTKPKTVGAEVAEVLRERLKADYEPGDELESEAAMATEFGVSQRAVRDALRILAQQGLIETRQGKRATVSRLRPVAVSGYFRLALDEDKQSMFDLIELREALETKAAYSAATRITPEQIQSMHEVLDAISVVSERADRVKLDLDFHFLIARASGNRFFESLFESLSTVLAEERRRGQEVVDGKGVGRAPTEQEHLAIYEALSAGDAGAAEAAMRRHLKNVAARLN